MQIIEFDEGYRTYQIGNDESRVIKIRLDPDLIERVKKAESAVSDLENRISTASSDELTALSDELKTIIDDAFKANISGPAFCGANVFTPVSSGKTLFQSFFEAFMPVIENDIKAFGTAAAEPRPEVRQYLKEEKPKLDISTLTAEEKLTLLEQFLK